MFGAGQLTRHNLSGVTDGHFRPALDRDSPPVLAHHCSSPDGQLISLMSCKSLNEGELRVLRVQPPYLYYGYWTFPLTSNSFG